MTHCSLLYVENPFNHQAKMQFAKAYPFEPRSLQRRQTPLNFLCQARKFIFSALISPVHARWLIDKGVMLRGVAVSRRAYLIAWTRFLDGVMLIMRRIFQLRFLCSSSITLASYPTRSADQGVSCVRRLFRPASRRYNRLLSNPSENSKTKDRQRYYCGVRG